MNALVIVDPQNDFINGSLAVPGAEKAINNTIEFIKEHKEDLAYIAITADWHPYDHCSFKEYGGTWESHCVMYSAGASIYQPLLEVIKETGIFCKVWNKGTYSDREEYSIFDREEGREFLDELNDRTTIDASKEEYGEIYVAGLAGDCSVSTISGFKSDEERDSAMTRDSDFDIAFVKDDRWDSGTAQNIKRRHNI